MKKEIIKRYNLISKASNNSRLQAIEMKSCKDDIFYFINNYVYTDRNSNLYDETRPNVLPFVLYPYQEEFVQEVWGSIVEGTKALADRKDFTNVFVEKSRQMGISWLMMIIFAYGFIFHNHKYLIISQKESDVDKIGNMKALLPKVRFVLNNLPKWMLPDGYTKKAGSEFNKHLTISRADGTGSITGESANPDAGRGGTYHACFMDEMAFMSNATTINTALSAATPCRIVVSTPNGQGNEFYRMRELTQRQTDERGELTIAPQVKGLRYHRSEHPLYSKERYDWKTQGMTPEKIAQELEIDYNTAIIGRVYPEFPQKPMLLLYDSLKPLYVFIDNSHGGKDPHAIIIAQITDHYIDCIDSIEVNASITEMAEFMAGSPRFALTDSQRLFFERYQTYNHKRAVFVADPYDTHSTHNTSTIYEEYRKQGIYLNTPSERDKKQQILKTRSNLYRIRYTKNCLDMASALMNAKYPERPENSKATTPNDKPIHDRTSHFRTALEYGVNYILENPINKKPRVAKDTRPQKDPYTRKLVYNH